MSESPVRIPCGQFTLEARFEQGDGAAAAVICHPHPLFGGSMDNNVVDALRAAFRKAGLGTLRFNFRGVGGSTGQHGGAQGDVGDLLAVIQFLDEHGSPMCCLSGYSYGAWIGLKAVNDGLNPQRAILVSPPLDFLDFKGLTPPSCPCLVTLGDQDDFCSVASVRNWSAPRLEAGKNPQVEVLAGCDHFYGGFEKRLAEKVTAFLQGVLP